MKKNHRQQKHSNNGRDKPSERRDWTTRTERINAVLKHVEEKRNNIDIETLAETLNMPLCVMNRIFNEIKNDYGHRFPWLKEDGSLYALKNLEEDKQ